MPRIIRPIIAGSPNIKIQYVKAQLPRGRSFNPRPPMITINPQIQAVLSKPTWSVAALLAPDTHDDPSAPSSNVTSRTVDDKDDDDNNITSEKLRHLLKLSALPPPKDAAEEQDMLKTLRQQIHFVKEIQKVNTTGVQPLVAIRDETHDSIWHNTVTADKLQGYFDQEENVGSNGTIRRRKDGLPPIRRDNDLFGPDGPIRSQILDDPFFLSTKGENEQDRRIGNYFYVQKNKARNTSDPNQQADHTPDKS